MRIRNSYKMLVRVALLALVAQGSSCTSDTPCSQDEHLDNGYCYPNPDGGAGVFGQSCSSSADCLPPTTICAPQINYCTAMGCDVDPTLCPAGWTCMDLSPYGVAGHMCFRQ